MTRTVHRVRLDFWGTICDCLMPTRQDAEHFATYFSEFGTASDDPRHVFLFETTGNGFVVSLLDAKVEKRIWHSEMGGEWTLWDKFHARSTAPSPVPPLTLEPLRQLFCSVHAAALTVRNGDALLFTGPSFSGKSALSLGLLDRGWGLMTDDLAVIGRSTKRVHAFRRPIGIRETTMTLVPGLAERVQRVDDVFCIHHNDITTYMVRAAHLEHRAPPRTAPVSGLVILAQDSSAKTPRLDHVPHRALSDALLTTSHAGSLPEWISVLPGWRLHFDVNRHFERVVDMISKEFWE